MLKLYYMPGACSSVPHVALEWSGLDYVAEKVDRAKIKSPEYLALNPQGAVPLLQEGSWVLTQNVAILDYINDLAPQANLFGKGDIRQRAKSRQWLAFVNADLHKAFVPLFAPNYYLDGDDAAAKLAPKALANILRLFGIANEQLAKSDYLNGELTIADVYLYVTLRWAKALKIDLSVLTALVPFFQRIEQNAGVQAVLKQQGLL